MKHCPYCNHELDEFIFHEGARDEPATVRYVCVLCGPVEAKVADKQIEEITK